MSEQFHVIIAGDESSPRSFQVSKKNVLITVALTLVTIIVLTAGSFFTAGFYAYNRILAKKMVTIKVKMDETQTINDNSESKLASTVEQKDRELEKIKIKNDLLISKMEGESSKRIAGLEKKILVQEASFKQERDLLLSTAVSELNERSDFIENVISDIGIKVKQSRGKTTQKNSGGPYIAAEEDTYDKLLYRADAYLKTIQGLPLGLPTKGRVTSWYGKRKEQI